MRHHKRGNAQQRSALAGVLLVLLLSSTLAACGSPPPVVLAGGAVYGMVVSANGTMSLVALAASDGAQLWQTPIPQDSESAVASVTATPALIYVVSGGKPSSGDWSLMAVHADTGKVAWSFAAGSLIVGMQTQGDLVYVGSLYGGGVRALRASDGRVQWQRAGNVAAFSLAGDTLYAAIAGIGARPYSVAALRASDGTLRWQTPLDEAADHLVVNQASIYVGTANEVIALRISDGAAQWRNQAAGGLLNGVAGGNVYVSQIASQTAQLVALRASDGLSLWQRQHASLPNVIPFPLITTSAVYLTISTDSFCALRPADGSASWCYQAQQVVPLAASDQTAYVSDAAGQTCALRASDGSQLWCQHLATASLVIGADRLALATAGNAVCLVQTASGKQDWCQQMAGPVFDLTLGL